MILLITFFILWLIVITAAVLYVKYIYNNDFDDIDSQGTNGNELNKYNDYDEYYLLYDWPNDL